MRTTFNSSDYYAILYVPAPKMNWPKIIQDLINTGLNYSQLSELIGKTQSTLQGWMIGKEPHYNNGAALLLLHQRLCGLETTKQRTIEAYCLSLPPHQYV